MIVTLELDINDRQLVALCKAVLKASQAQEITIRIRKDGMEHHFEGDWLKDSLLLLKEPPAPAPAPRRDQT
jgi:hypothetical protein